MFMVDATIHDAVMARCHRTNGASAPRSMSRCAMVSGLDRCVLPDIEFSRIQGRAVMLDSHKMAVTLSVLWITTAPTMTLATAQDAALSERERHGLAACLVKCPDGDKACVNRCMSKSQTRGVVWSDATRAMHQTLSDRISTFPGSRPTGGQ